MRARRIPTFPTFPPTLSRRRSRRRGQSGQVAPIVGLFAILLLAAAALATDLSVTTNLKRSLQNQTDAAALAAAARLPASPQGRDQQDATATALSLLHNTYPWPTGVLTDSQDHYVEVVMQQEEGTFFAGVLGVSISVDGAHSIAYNFAPNQPFPFALYSRTFVQ